MASFNDGQVYNTQLFNVVLEAMDNFKPVLFCENNGSAQIFSSVNTYMGNINDGFRIVVENSSFGSFVIFPSENAASADLYIPKNISPKNGSVS